MHRDLNTDLFSGLIGIIFTVIFWFAKEGVGELSIKFPKALLLLAGTFSTALLIKGLWKSKAEHAPVFSEGNRIRMLVTGIALFLWLVAVIFIGFYVGSVIVFFALTCYLAAARQKLRPGVLVLWLAIITVEVAVFDAIFSRLLYIPLPRGILF